MTGKLKLLVFILCFFSAEVIHAQGWTRVTTLPARAIYSLEILNGTMYAGATDTLYISKDKGATWSSKRLPTSGYNVNAIALYNGRLYVGTGDGVFVTGDGGTTWESGNIHLTITSFTAWKGFLYASTDGAGIFQCIQIGNSWSPFNQNYPVAASGKVARVITMGKSLFAAGGTNGAGYRFDSSTSQWREIFYAGSGTPNMVVYDLMQGAGSVFALNNPMKMLRSDDSASTWYADTTDMRQGINGRVFKASMKYYVAWNLDTGTWLQSRDISAAPAASWATGEELLPTGTTFTIREYDRRLFLGRDKAFFINSMAVPRQG